MSHALEGIKAKLDRADHHLRSLDGELTTFFETEPHAFRAELDLDASRYRVYVDIREPVPIGVSVIVGDAIQNLRAALDHLVWQLVLLAGNKPSRSNAFPLYVREPTKPKARARYGGCVAGVAPLHAAVIEQAQPYKAGDSPNEHALAILADLSNTDKHQLVLARCSAIPQHDLATLAIIAANDVLPITGYNVIYGKPLEHGAQIIETPVVVTGPDPQVNVQGHVPFEVAFGNALVMRPGLWELRTHVRGLIEKVFEPLFE